MDCRRLLAIPLLCTMLAGSLHAQTEPEYCMEAGVGMGLMSYEGDFNGSVLKCMQPSAALLYRYLFNPRMGLRVALDYGRLKGESADANTAYPGYDTGNYSGGAAYSFSNTLLDLDLTYEYNFWPYGTGKDYRGAKRLTPFMFLGVGMTFAGGDSDNVFTMNVPLGFGIKYKLGPRLNLGVEWGMHFTLSDRLDGVEDPYQVKSSGVFKNADCYSRLTVSLTYSFKERCRVCHNQDE